MKSRKKVAVSLVDEQKKRYRERLARFTLYLMVSALAGYGFYRIGTPFGDIKVFISCVVSAIVMNMLTELDTELTLLK